jgi:hypothetical protein
MPFAQNAGPRRDRPIPADWTVIRTGPFERDMNNVVVADVFVLTEAPTAMNAALARLLAERKRTAPDGSLRHGS